MRIVRRQQFYNEIFRWKNRDIDLIRYLNYFVYQLQ